jgi:hypothetical protein
MATLEQLLAESLPTPPSCIGNAKFDFPTHKGGVGNYLTLGEVEALFTDKTSSASLHHHDADSHTVPQLTADIAGPDPAAVDDAHTAASVPEMGLAMRVPSGPSASPAHAPVRQLRKRRQSQRYNVDDSSSDEEDADPTPEAKRNRALRRQHQHRDDASDTSYGSRPRRAAAPKAQPATPSNSGSFSDDEFAHEHMMSPEEERELRNLLAQRQAELDECTKHMEGMTAAQKKRLRNKHASCVSRLKKKLYICNLLRELEKAREEATHAKDQLAHANGTIAALQRERVLRQQGRAPSSQPASSLHTSAVSVSPASGFRYQPVKPQQQQRVADVRELAPAVDSKVYCLCRGEASETMIQCDRCSEWFHTECVGLTSDQARTLPRWQCPTCSTTAALN